MLAPLALPVRQVALVQPEPLVQRVALVQPVRQVHSVTQVVVALQEILVPLALLVLHLRLARLGAPVPQVRLVFLELLRQPARLVQPVMLQL